MPQIHVSLVDNPPSRKLADVEVHLPAATIEIHQPDLERSADLPVVLRVPAETILGITIWSTPQGPIVTFPTALIFPTPPTVFGASASPTHPATVPVKRVLAALVDDILTAYHDAKRAAP